MRVQLFFWRMETDEKEKKNKTLRYIKVSPQQSLSQARPSATLNSSPRNRPYRKGVKLPHIAQSVQYHRPQWYHVFTELQWNSYDVSGNLFGNTVKLSSLC